MSSVLGWLYQRGMQTGHTAQILPAFSSWSEWLSNDSENVWQSLKINNSVIDTQRFEGNKWEKVFLCNQMLSQKMWCSEWKSEKGQRMSSYESCADKRCCLCRLWDEWFRRFTVGNCCRKRDQPLPKLCTYKVVLSFMGFSLLMFAVLD